MTRMSGRAIHHLIADQSYLIILMKEIYAAIDKDIYSSNPKSLEIPKLKKALSPHKPI